MITAETPKHPEIFDVAKWSRSDIAIAIRDESPVPIAEETIEYLISGAIDLLGDYFDASIGINWDTIAVAVTETLEDYSYEDKKLEGVKND